MRWSSEPSNLSLFRLTEMVGVGILTPNLLNTNLNLVFVGIKMNIHIRWQVILLTVIAMNCSDPRVTDPDKGELGYPAMILENVEEMKEDYLNSGMPWILPKRAHRSLDSNGVPIVHYPWGDHHNPVTTSYTAIAFYQNYLKSDDARQLNSFFNNADWLLDNMDSVGYLHYDFAYQHTDYVLDSGWTSGMAQGQALSVLSIAYNVTNSKKYLDGAEKIFSTFFDRSSPYRFIDVENGYLYIEEYPNPDSCHVLNGQIFGTWGLWDYYVVSGSETSLDLFCSSLQTIVDNYLQWFISENKTKYCLHNAYKEKYHHVHLRQLESLHAITKNNEFRRIKSKLSHEHFITILNNYVSTIRATLLPS